MKKNTEYILFYCKDKEQLTYFNNRVEIPLFDLIKEKESHGKSYEYDQVLLNLSPRKRMVGNIESRTGEIAVYEHKEFLIKSVKEIAREEKISIFDVYTKYLDRIFRTQDSQSSIRHKVTALSGTKTDKIFSIEYVPDTGRNKGMLTRVLYFKGEQVNFLSATTKIVDKEIIKTRPLGSLWTDIGWDGIANEGGVRLKNGKKPEKLIHRIIDLCTNRGDIVLDFFMGSGTTAAVAHKMARQYLGIEQLDYGLNDAVQRLKNVIAGDATGISKVASWKGGGDFVYCELMKYNEDFVTAIEDAKDSKNLLKVWAKIKMHGFVKHTVDLKDFDENIDEFKKLSLDEQKKILLQALDKNQLYVNLSEIDDEDFSVSREDKEMNKEFYTK